MQYLQIVSEQPAPILGDQRRSHRQQVSQLLAVTAKGSGRIIDINSGGISFKCLYPHTFPQEMEIDILGENGILIKGVRVEKNWEEDSYTPGHQTDRFEKITGLKFTGMSHRQSAEIEELIEQLESAAFVSA